MTNIFLNDATVYLSTVNMLPQDFETRAGMKPAVIVHANLEELQVEESKLEGNVRKIRGALMNPPLMATENILNPMMNLSFVYDNLEVSFRIPIQFFTVSLALSRLGSSNGSDSGVPIFLVDSNQVPYINPAKVLPAEAISIILLFDAKKSLYYTESLLGNIDTRMVQPITPEPWISSTASGESVKSKMTRTVLGDSLKQSLKISKGLVVDEDSFTTYGVDQIMITDLWRLEILTSVLDRVYASSPRLTSIYQDSPRNSFTDIENMKFASIVSNLDFNGEVEDLLQSEVLTQNMEKDPKQEEWEHRVAIWEAPAKESWHPTMVNFYEYLKNNEMLDEVEEIVEVIQNEELSDLVEGYNPSTIQLSIATYIAMQAYKISATTGIKPQKIILEWFSSLELNPENSNDGWMLLSLEDEISERDYLNAIDLLTFQKDNSPVPKVIPFAVMLIAELYSWMERNDSEFDELLEHWTMNSASMAMEELSLIRSHVEHMDRIIESSEGKIEENLLNISNTAFIHVFGEEENIEKIALLYLKALVQIAEFVAYEEENEMNEEWFVARSEFISETLVNIVNGMVWEGI